MYWAPTPRTHRLETHRMTPHPTETPTSCLQQLERGDRAAAAKLFPLVYEELRALAAHFMQQERTDHTLEPTALVHEAYLRLIDQRNVDWKNRAHFFAIASQAIRRVLVDHARRRKAAKRGGGGQRVTLSEDVAISEDRTLDVADLDDALLKLTQLHERQARVVELRFFGGLSLEEAAEALGVSRTTVADDWTVARAWLSRELSGGEAA
jgi:RNA polymerase sigma factor (TIGR02999 family)